MNQNEIMDQRTIFRHGVRTSEELMDIINFLERILPGARVNTAEAIRFAIASQAIVVRKEKRLMEVN